MQMLLLRLANHLRGNLDDVGLADAEVEPLIAYGAMGMNLDAVGEGTTGPAIIVGGEHERTVGEAGDAEGAGADDGS